MAEIPRPRETAFPKSVCLLMIDRYEVRTVTRLRVQCVTRVSAQCVTRIRPQCVIRVKTHLETALLPLAATIKLTVHTHHHHHCHHTMYIKNGKSSLQLNTEISFFMN